MLREKFSVAYRKQILEEVDQTHFALYDSLMFLQPFVSLKLDTSKKVKSDDSFSSNSSSYAVTKSPLDEQVLIQLVKERPELFDKKHEDFRVISARRKAWDEISAVVGWDVDTLQKRWRVMRDRFVRELRKSKNVESDSQLNCSSFFREMLFLTQHVRSKKYEVEAHLDDSELYEYEQCDNSNTSLNAKKEDASQEQIYENFIIENDSEEPVRFDDGMLEEHIEVQDDDFIEEIIECSQNDQDEMRLTNEGETGSTDTIAFDDYPKSSWMKRENPTIPHVISHKRRGSETDDIQPKAKIAHISETSPTEPADNDEDITFGNTLGCMLKRIPQHLKTAVKLKLLQSLAEFEAEHKI